MPISTATPSESDQSRGISLGSKVAILVGISIPPIILASTSIYFLGSDFQLNRQGNLFSERLRNTSRPTLIRLLAITLGIIIITSAFMIYCARQILRSVERGTIRNQQIAEASSQQAMNVAVQNIHAARTSKRKIFSTVAEEARRILLVDRALVMLINQELEGVIIAESVDSEWPKATELPFTHPLLEAEESSSEDTQDVEIIPWVEQETLPEPYQDWLTRLEVEASLTVPIRINGELKGILVTHQCEEPREWQNSEIEFAQQLILQAVFALEAEALGKGQGHLRQQLNEEILWKQYLVDASQYLHEATSQEQVLNAAVEESRRVIASDRVVIYSTDQESQGIIIAESVAPGWPRTLGKTISDPCFEAKYISLYEDGRVRAWEDINTSGLSACYIEQLASISVRANLVAPVLHEGKLLGLLVAHQCSGPRKWKDREIRWFTNMAVQVGFALDNTKLLRRAEAMQATPGVPTMANEMLEAQVSELLTESRQVFDALSEVSHQQISMATQAMTSIHKMTTSIQSMYGAVGTAALKAPQSIEIIQTLEESATEQEAEVLALKLSESELMTSLESLQEKVPQLSDDVQKILQLTTDR